MRTIPREVIRAGTRIDPVETTRRRLSNAKKSELKMYLLGALHDATFNSKHKTYRFTQSSEVWLKLIRRILAELGHKSWIYREGQDRYVWALETSAKIDRSEKPKTIDEKIAYSRGYFDAEGGMPRNSSHFLYFQFSQKDKDDLTEVWKCLTNLGIKCGTVHNPSKKVDDNYWRFFVSRTSHWKFMSRINSWHPRKAKQMELRMKI
jgi:hypothetical protein